MPSLQQWMWLIVIILSTGTQGSSSDEVTTPATQVPQVEVHGPRDLVCFLRRRPMDGCSNKNADLTPGSGISARIQDIYSKMRSSLRAFIAQGSLASAAPQLFSELHPVIFYLMPHGDDRLRAGGEALARYVRGRGGESAAISVATALLDDVDDRDIFISKLAGVLLPERSQSLLGEHLVKWFPGTDDWKFERFGKVLKAGNPLVGSLPSPFLTSLPSDTIERFLFLLSQWETLGSTKGDQWFSKGKAVARTWSLMVIKSQQPHHLSRWKSLSYHRYSFLLLGFTPDELLKMSNPGSEVWSDIFQLKFDRLQARAVFQAMVGNGSSLKEGDLKNGIPLFSTPLLPLLSPFQLAGSFNHSVADFGALNYLPGKRFENPSFATALQLSHCLIAQCMHAKMSNSSVKGNGRTSEIVDAILISDGASSAGKEHLPLECFIHAGQFAYSLPLPLFRNQNISKIDPKLLKDTDSDELSILQGRLLTRHLTIHLEDDEKQPLNQIINSTFLVGADDLMAFGPGLLRGILPTSSITSLNVHEVPQKVIQHLLDVDNPWHLSHEEELSLRSLAILQKLGDELSESWVLKHILGSESPVQILRHLPPQQLKELSKDIVSNSNVITLSALHHSTLSTLLDVALPELLMRGPGGGKWSLEALTLRAMPLLRGMDCRHLLLVDPHDVVVVLGQYNKQRQDKGRVKYQPFPKNLQNCAIRALASHLELKAALWSGANVTNLSSVDVMQAFEASDAESVGGYVIAGLPERVLEYLGADALRLVGQLNPQELLMALYGKHHPSDIALILLKQLGMASDMEVEEEALKGLRGVPKYSVGRLGSRWLEWSGRRAAASLIPLLFGSLLQFLPPDIVDPASLKWTLESASPEGKLVCMGTKQRQSWYSTLVQAFGPPEKWTSSTLGGLGDFLLVVPEESLGHIAKDSWAEAIDTLVENTRYFTRNMQTPSGFLSYYEVCAKTLPKAEEEAYVSAVKRLARFMLEAMQWHLDSVTPYGKIIFGQRSNGSSPGGIGEETVVHVPGLRRPSLKSTVAPPHLPLNSSGRTTREGKERKAEEQPKSVRGTATEVSCSAIRAVSPELVALALKPEDIKLMTSQEMGDCVDTLGLAPLERDVLRVVWEKAKESDLPLELEDLGKVVSVMPLEDLLAFNVTVSSNLDAVSTLGREISNWELVDALALHVMPRGGGGEALGVEAAAAMGVLLCGLPPEKLPRPQVVFRVAPLVSQSLVSGLRGGRGCPPLPCLRALASAASSWLGKPVGKDGWTAMELSFLGVLAAGLEEGTLQSLAVSDGADKGKHTLSGLDISSLECMPEYILKNLSGMFVSQLSQLAAMRLMEEAEGVLTEDATSTLKGVEQSPFDRMVFHEKGGVEGAKDGSEMKVEESTSEGVIAGGAAVTTAGGVALFWSGALLVAVAQMVL